MEKINCRTEIYHTCIQHYCDLANQVNLHKMISKKENTADQSITCIVVHKEAYTNILVL